MLGCSDSVLTPAALCIMLLLGVSCCSSSRQILRLPRSSSCCWWGCHTSLLTQNSLGETQPPSQNAGGSSWQAGGRLLHPPLPSTAPFAESRACFPPPPSTPQHSQRPTSLLQPVLAVPWRAARRSSSSSSMQALSSARPTAAADSSPASTMQGSATVAACSSCRGSRSTGSSSRPCWGGLQPYSGRPWSPDCLQGSQVGLRVGLRVFCT